MNRSIATGLGFVLLAAAVSVNAGEAPDAREVLRTYAAVAQASYRAAHRDAVALGSAVDALVDGPTPHSLNSARTAWLHSRRSYGRSETFRFSGGPIDVVDPGSGERSLELRLNAWPVDESRIDAVRGRPDGGLIQDLRVPIDRGVLVARNLRDSETEVTTGYHAIEFLLWGQDLRDDGPGERAASDFDAATEIGRRRGVYLRTVTSLLIDDLASLVEAWSGKPGSYAAKFVVQPEATALRQVFTGLGRFSSFEMAMERLAVPLDSGDPEDEHSCFSDNTHEDFVANVAGIENVYRGRYEEFEGTGLDVWLAATDPQLAQAVAVRLAGVRELADRLHRPFDRILAAPADSAQRVSAERLVGELMALSDLWNLARVRAAALP